MNSRKIEKYIEVIPGLVLGIVSAVLGSLFIADGCNLALPIPSSGPACQVPWSNLLVPVGLLLVTLGALVFVASIAVLRRRKY